MANFHNELDRIQVKYSKDAKATEALKEQAKAFYEFLSDFIQKAQDKKNNSVSLS